MPLVPIKQKRERNWSPFSRGELRKMSVHEPGKPEAQRRPETLEAGSTRETEPGFMGKRDVTGDR